MHLSPLVVLLSLILWGWIWGAAGLLLAVPITMVIQIALEHSPDARWVALLLGPSRGAPAGASRGQRKAPLSTSDPGAEPRESRIGRD